VPEPRPIAPGIRERSNPVRVLAASQHGVFSRAEGLELGLSSSALARALRTGRLHRVHDGVHSLMPPELLGEEGRLVAARLAAGPGALLVRGTAAWRWGLTPAPPQVIELGVPGPRRPPAGVSLMRTGRLRPDDVVLDAPFPTTSVPRTLLDLAARYERRPLLRALAEAEFRHDLRPADVEGTLRRGHPGSARLRAALAEHVPGHGTTKSGLERRFRRGLIARGIELPERNVRLGRWEVDCLWRAERLVVELDGAQHERPHQAAVDADRDLWLRARGYVVRRYGDRQVRERPGDVIGDLAAAFAEAAVLARHPGPIAPGTRE